MLPPFTIVPEPEHVTQQPAYSVVGVDGIPHSKAAVDVAFEEAVLRGAALRALYVWHPPLLGVLDVARGPDDPWPAPAAIRRDGTRSQAVADVKGWNDQTAAEPPGAGDGSLTQGFARHPADDTGDEEQAISRIRVTRTGKERAGTEKSAAVSDTSARVAAAPVRQLAPLMSSAR